MAPVTPSKRLVPALTVMSPSAWLMPTNRSSTAWSETTLVPMFLVSLCLVTDTPVTAPPASTPTTMSIAPWEPVAETSTTQPACCPPDMALYRAVTPGTSTSTLS